MFNGIIQSIGVIEEINNSITGRCYEFKSKDGFLKDANLGDSIAVNGVCLTVIKIKNNNFLADVSKETLDCTNFNDLKLGQRVNMEKSLKLTQGIDGHLVSGHVDGVCVIKNRYAEGENTRFEITATKDLIKYIARKGSVCVNGVSLTVNKVLDNTFYLNIVPYTLKNTILEDLNIGDRVNLEIDIIARYLEQLLKHK